MKNIGEFGLIDRISTHFTAPAGVTGIGDDCAVIPQKSGLDTLISTDLLVEGRHFLLEDVSPRDLGWKSAAVNISDIAAMGGRPESAFLSIALPGSLDAGWMDGFIEGFATLCKRYGVQLLGGDTSLSPDRLFINITVTGSCPHGSAKLRRTACPGDIICVTGTLGDSACGLQLILERRGAAKRPFATQPLPEKDAEYLIERHYRPIPRVEEGIKLSSNPAVHAMMDVSDGIASDLRHILDASGCGAAVNLPELPLSESLQRFCLSRGTDPYSPAVEGGEDYELLFTIEPGADAGVPCTPVGTITEGKGGIEWLGGSKKDYKGFTHF